MSRRNITDEFKAEAVQLVVAQGYSFSKACEALGVGDTLSLSSAVDAMFLVVRLDWLRTTTADDLGRVLNSAPVTKLGFVVTGADLSKAYGYGSYGHTPVAGVPRPGARTERASEANT